MIFIILVQDEPVYHLVQFLFYDRFSFISCTFVTSHCKLIVNTTHSAHCLNCVLPGLCLIYQHLKVHNILPA